MRSGDAIRAAETGRRPDRAQALALADYEDLGRLTEIARQMTFAAHGPVVTFSKKVFIPLTQLCRDVCHYCTFAHPPRRGEDAYLSRDAVLAIAKEGQRAGCKEALFTLGDKPEMRYRVAREALAARGHSSTLDLLAEMAELVLNETGLLPHLNAGVMDRHRLETLRQVSVSQGLMLEGIAPGLMARGGPHFGSPDKAPDVRLETIAAAGEAGIPFTTGILIGIGETRRDRIEALLALRDLHDRYGHLQEIIVQNFRAKPGTRMADAPEPTLEDHLWTIAVARLIFGGEMTIQAPPNLRAGALEQLVSAGINDWGGVSPVTPDHVNPEAPWPHLVELEQATERAGRTLAERLAIYPGYAAEAETWLAPALRTPTLKLSDGASLARDDCWTAGAARAARPPRPRSTEAVSPRISETLSRLQDGCDVNPAAIADLFHARGRDADAVTSAADRLRRDTVGDSVTYAVNRNINYTNVCVYSCRFCAFSKGRLSQGLRDTPYALEIRDVAALAIEAWNRGATEVCLQGGIRPDYTGDTYLAIAAAVRGALPDIHIHAFSPLEVWHGAKTLSLELQPYLTRLKAAGLDSLPGTAAEILDDDVRQVLCADKITTHEWLAVMEAAHAVGLKSTATIMFGHVDRYHHWARHLLAVRDLQRRTGGFTEFVPLPFVPMEAPIYLQGRSRKGPSYREALLMHAVGRLVLHPHITNIQASWVKMGLEGAAACLDAGANDLGGSLMNESITRAAGAAHGQEQSPATLESLIRGAGRIPRQRTTFYGTPSDERRRTAKAALTGEEIEPAIRPKLIAAE